MTSIRSPHALSLAIHLGLAALLFTTAVRVSSPPTAPNRQPLFFDLSDYRRILAPAPEGGGGGGDRSPLPVSFGQLPKAAPRQFAPPMIIDQPRESPLLVEPSLIITADVPAVNLAQWGDPTSTFRGLSNGPGERGGMGSGSDRGIGPGPGPGAGRGDQTGVSGLRSSTQSGVTAPQVLYKIEPEFSDEARRAKHQGIVQLSVDIDAAGRPANIRVVRALGLGLDEKAVEAVSRWKFRAGTRDGKPVTMRAVVEVSFHLL
jgi:periplasmic protein TonB